MPFAQAMGVLRINRPSQRSHIERVNKHNGRKQGGLSVKAEIVRKLFGRIMGRRVTLALGAVIVAGGAALISCVTMEELVILPPGVPGATFVGNRKCSLCHKDEVKVFQASTHARLTVPGAEADGSSGCEACHGPGSKHVAAETGGFIVNPGKSSEACFRCHVDTEMVFHLPYSHPVAQGKMTCAQCHDPHGKDIMKPGQLAMARTNDSCNQCHKEQSRPHLFDHEALREGCSVCHAPHGSINKKMLVQNDNSLCLKCHAQGQLAADMLMVGDFDHTTRRVSRGTCWSAGCHTAIHGSNINAHFRY